MNAAHRKQSLRFPLSRWPLLLGLAAALALPWGPSHAAEAIRIGEINSRHRLSTAGQAYRNGLALALEQINAAGGVGGRPLQLVVREDDGDADQAARNARALISQDHVEVLTGSMLSDVALAVSREAARGRTVLVVGDALSDAITLDKGNRYTFRVRPSTYMQAAMLAEQAARLPGRRWAVVAPNYEYGQSAVASFKLLLKQARPDVEFVSDQWPALGKIKADDVARAIRQSRPDGIFNATFGEDLQKFVQAGNRQQLFEGVRVVSMASAGAPSLDPSQSEAIRDWLAIGYPWDQVSLPEHQRFLEAYLKRFSERPQLSAVFGYTTMMAIAACSSARRWGRSVSARWTSRPRWAPLSAWSRRRMGAAACAIGAIWMARPTCRRRPTCAAAVRPRPRNDPPRPQSPRSNRGFGLTDLG